MDRGLDAAAAVMLLAMCARRSADQEGLLGVVLVPLVLPRRLFAAASGPDAIALSRMPFKTW